MFSLSLPFSRRPALGPPCCDADCPAALRLVVGAVTVVVVVIVISRWRLRRPCPALAMVTVPPLAAAALALTLAPSLLGGHEDDVLLARDGIGLEVVLHRGARGERDLGPWARRWGHWLAGLHGVPATLLLLLLLLLL